MTLSFFSVVACSDCDCEKNSKSETENCASCDCEKNNADVTEKKSSWKDKLGKGSALAGAAVAGAAVANKLHCDRFDIEVEYMLLDACLNTCSGVANRESRISKCAAAIQEMECKKSMKSDEISRQVQSSCPI